MPQPLGRSTDQPPALPAGQQLPRAPLHGWESTSPHRHQQTSPAPLGLGCSSPRSPACVFPSIRETILNEGREGVKTLSPFNPTCTRDRRKPLIPPCVKSLDLLFCLQRNKAKAFPCSSFSFWTVTAHLTSREHQEENQPATEVCSSPTFSLLLPQRFPHMQGQGEGSICPRCCAAGCQSPQITHLD